MNSSRKPRIILFDRSTADACLDYLKDRSKKKIEILTSATGGGLAYGHHMWSSIGTELTIEQFWK